MKISRKITLDEKRRNDQAIFAVIFIIQKPHSFFVYHIYRCDSLSDVIWIFILFIPYFQELASCMENELKTLPSGEKIEKDEIYWAILKFVEKPWYPNPLVNKYFKHLKFSDIVVFLAIRFNVLIEKKEKKRTNLSALYDKTFQEYHGQFFQLKTGTTTFTKYLARYCCEESKEITILRNEGKNLPNKDFTNGRINE